MSVQEPATPRLSKSRVSAIAQERRLTLLGRVMLEQAGATDADAQKAMRRFREGLDAMAAKPYRTKRGVKWKRLIDFTERRLAAIEIAKLFDYYPTRVNVEVSGPGGGPVQVATLDFSKLSLEKMRQLRDLLAEARREEPKAIENGGGA